MRIKLLLMVFPLLLSVSACPFQDDDGQGSVTLYLTTRNSSRRTIIPEIAPTIEEYRITCTGAGTATETTTETTVELILATGMWDILIEALNPHGGIVARGLLEDIQISMNEPKSETVILNPSQNGSGGLSLSVTWPESISIPLGNIELSFDGTSIALESDPISYTTTSLEYKEDVVDSGSDHTFWISLLPEAASGATTKMDSVHVYDEVITLYTYSLGESDFAMTPAAPDGLAATTLSYNQIALAWNDHSDHEDGFKIERSLDGSSFSEIETVSADTVSYWDADLLSGTRYYYRVRAYNGFGNSGYSNSADDITIDALIIDHTSIAQFENIPQPYIDEAKTMWIQFLGESHSQAYRDGVDLLENLYPIYQAEGQEMTDNDGEPLPPTDEYLRVSRIRWTGGWNVWGCGEEDFWTSRKAIDEIKANIEYCNGAGGNPVHAVGFAWCWDMVDENESPYIDDTYGTHWYGRAWYYEDGGLIENEHGWGLDPSDETVTQNPINLDDYIEAIEEINDSSHQTITFFTTGPPDTTGEIGYQRWLKHEHIREHVQYNGGYYSITRTFSAGTTLGSRRQPNGKTTMKSITFSRPCMPITPEKKQGISLNPALFVLPKPYG